MSKRRYTDVGEEEEFFDPFGDRDRKSPLEHVFSEVESSAEESTEPETEEEQALAKIPFDRINGLIRSYFSSMTGTLAQGLPILQEVWYDYTNDCPHLTLKLQQPFLSVSEFQLAGIRSELLELGDLLAPIFSSQVAISVEVCDDDSPARTF